MVVNYKSTYIERDTENSLKNVSTLKTSFGAKPNVLQFCPLSNVYVVQLLWEIIFIYSLFIHEVYCDIHH
jgi:hypothetical protein